MDNTMSYQYPLITSSLDTLDLKEYEEYVAMVTKSSFPKKPYEAPKVSEDVPYYDRGGISTIDVIRSKLTPEQYEGFLLGNIIKYSLRSNFKGCKKQDANKIAEYAMWYNETQSEKP